MKGFLGLIGLALLSTLAHSVSWVPTNDTGSMFIDADSIVSRYNGSNDVLVSFWSKHPNTENTEIGDFQVDSVLNLITFNCTSRQMQDTEITLIDENEKTLWRLSEYPDRDIDGDYLVFYAPSPVDDEYWLLDMACHSDFINLGFNKPM